MQLAHILSDLTSLLVCDNKPAAARLILARPAPANAPVSITRKRNTSQLLTKAAVIKDADQTQPDEDLGRAYTLLELHQEVKTAYTEDALEQSGSSSLDELREARDNVMRALQSVGVDSVSLEQIKSADHSDETFIHAKEHDDVDEDIEDEDVSAWA